MDMRKRLLIVLGMALLPVACHKGGMESGSEAIRIQASLPSSVTKVALGTESEGSFPVLWQEGDQVSLNGNLSRPLSAGLSGGESAPFAFMGFEAAAPYHLLYPGDVGNGVSLDGSVLPMYAAGSDIQDVFYFHHLACGVRLQLLGDLSVSSLTLSATGGEAVAGSFTVSYADGTLAPVSASDSVTIDFATPVSLSPLHPVSFFVFFAPGSFSGGLTLTAEDASAAVTRSWRFATGATLEKGKIYLLPETAFASRELSDGFECSLEEMTEELISFEL